MTGGRSVGSGGGEGSYVSALTLATDDLDGLFKRLVDRGAEVLEEPTELPYGVRDCSFRDPAGILLRVNELRPAR